MAKEYLQQTEQFARQKLAGVVGPHGELVLDHTERVVALVHTESLKALAWLHDVVEDTPVTHERLFVEGFPGWLREGVRALTKREDESGEVGYRAYIGRIIDSHNGAALLVKRADLIDHLRPNCPPSLRSRYQLALERIDGQIERMLEDHRVMTNNHPVAR